MDVLDFTLLSEEEEHENLQDSKNYIDLDFESGGQATCIYINRLDQILTNNQNLNLTVVESMLDTAIKYDVKEANHIKSNMLASINKLKSNTTNAKELIRISRVLAKNFNRFHQLIVNMNQMNTIKLSGLDTDKIVELEDVINDDKMALKDALDSLSQAYKQFFNECDQDYLHLNSKHKNLIVINIKKILDRTQIDEDIELVQENQILDFVLGLIRIPVSAAIRIIKRFWWVIAGALGVKWLFGLNLFQIVFNLLGTGIQNTIIVFAFILILCLSMWIYHKYYDYTHSKENKILDAKLDQANRDNLLMYMDETTPPSKEITSDNVSISKDVPNVFRGFGNQGSYKPDDSKNKTSDEYNIF